MNGALRLASGGRLVCRRPIRELETSLTLTWLVSWASKMADNKEDKALPDGKTSF